MDHRDGNRRDENLRAQLAPFILRRTKQEVAKDLPEKIETDQICDLTGDQRLLDRPDEALPRDLRAAEVALDAAGAEVAVGGRDDEEDIDIGGHELRQQIRRDGRDNAEAQAAGAEIGERVIRAPFSGWVSLRNISVGAIASQGTEIATISDVSTIKLDFTVPETMLRVIRPGLPIEARSAAYPDQPFRGTIHTIDPVVDPSTRAVTVRARLPNPERLLRPGMLLTVLARPQQARKRALAPRPRHAPVRLPVSVFRHHVGGLQPVAGLLVAVRRRHAAAQLVHRTGRGGQLRSAVCQVSAGR
mgnify:CR=1 FL=1